MSPDYAQQALIKLDEARGRINTRQTVALEALVLAVLAVSQSIEDLKLEVRVEP